MNRTDFGKLIAALRKEHEDEQDLPWTQETLAREANAILGKGFFTEDVISNIERGKRGLDEETLLALAAALQLTSGERKEFFLASSGINSYSIAREGNDPQETLAQLTRKLKLVCLPAHILDSYCDVVAINRAVIEVFDFESVGLGLGALPDTCFTYNMARFTLSDEVGAHLNRLTGDDWSDHAFETMMFFRTASLRYRATEYFQALLQELKKSRLFNWLWREVYLEERDYCADNRSIRMVSPKWGPVAFFHSYLTALTTVGELHFVTWVPASKETSRVFSYIIDNGGADVFQLTPWPDKRVIHAASLIRPIH